MKQLLFTLALISLMKIEPCIFRKVILFILFFQTSAKNKYQRSSTKLIKIHRNVRDRFFFSGWNIRDSNTARVTQIVLHSEN